MKVLVTGRIPDEVLSILKAHHEVDMHEEDQPMGQEILRRVTDIEGLLCMITDRVDEELLNAAPRLRMIANLGVGYDNIHLAAVTARKIPVSNTPGVLTDATADLAFALILSVARRVVEGDKRVRAGEFGFWAPLHFLGREVSGRTLGIVGMGQIGRAVAKRAKGFQMRVLYCSRHPLGKPEEESLGAAPAPLGQLLEEADFVSLHVPLTQETHHLIGARELEKMKPTAYLINTARGPVVDEEALVEALRDRKIAGAGLDVFEREPLVTDELKELDDVVLLPHVGSATLETRTKMAATAAENLLRGLAGERPPNCLNWEEIS